jgi:NAD(P)H-hydrate epimerase
MAERIFKLPRLAPRERESHKGDFGRALLVGGSRGMSGAIALSGMACQRSGAGLVTLAVPDACLDAVASFDPCYMTTPLPCDAAGRLVAEAAPAVLQRAASSTALALGPGISKSDEITALVSELYRGISQPLVVDADALNALASQENGLANPGGPRVLTPHPGEFQRLSSASASDRGHQIAAARELAVEHDIVIVLKGHETYVTDGARFFLNETGNPGMATGGTGDVLTGVITALLCQGLSPFDAACLGVHTHGLAGDLAAQQLGQVGMIASDLVRFLPQAW